MTAAPIFSAWLGMVGNHLWQSTVFALIAALLTLALRRNRAQVRYAVWLAASMKFLVPFAALVAFGRQFSWRAAAPRPQPALSVVWETVSQPFSIPEPHLAVAGSSARASSSVASMMPLLIFAVWCVGCVGILALWAMRWRRIAIFVRSSTRVEAGRELDALRRLEYAHGMAQRIALISSDTSLEPGVFGIARPVLLWPRGIGARLDEGQTEAILSHEVCHVRRRDNLAAALHMLVAAVFWFHPIVWWLGARLVDERERACDEEVIRLGRAPLVYAESLLKTCEFYLKSPLVCVAGVTGSDLKTRIERIMTDRAADALSSWRKFMLAAVGVAALAAPIAVGALNAPRLLAQISGPDGKSLTFETASIKQNKSSDNVNFVRAQAGGRFTATNTTLRSLITFAFGSPGQRLPGFQIAGGPNWIDTDRFDIVAKAPGDPAPGALGPPLEMLSMVRSLLTERFKLTVHHEARELPIYALVMARSDGKVGPQLHPVEVDCVARRAEQRAALANNAPPSGPPSLASIIAPCSIGQFPGNWAGFAATMSQVANALQSDRIVEDRTGLSGQFDLTLSYTPDQMPSQAPPPGAPALPSIDPNGPSLFTALQEQLGLKLESTKGPVDVLVIDRAEHPTEN